VIPLHDDVPARRFPVVTAFFIAANVAVFVFELTLPRAGLTLTGLYARAGVTPFELAHGLDVPPRDLVPWWATMFSAMFIHGGWLHLIFNMLYLWIFGNSVEDAMTRPRFVALYLVCGMVATATQVMSAASSTVPLIGASGAIAGVLGAYIVLFPRARVLSVLTLGVIFPVVSVPAWILLGVWLAIQAVEGLLSFGHPAAGVAFFAHVGGFVAGMGLALLLARRPRRATFGRRV
jgi:membrane associated rhomboid family serine protease